MKQKRKKKEFNDLLIPIILVMSVLPFVVRLITYQSGLAKYTWYSDNDITYDFFTYYKSYAFILISLVSAIILIAYYFLKREQIKKMKLMIPIGVYSILVIISTLFSINLRASTVGGTAHFESVFVIIGYIIILIYTYQIDKKEEDYISLLKALILSLIPMSIIGLLQMLGKDLLYDTWVQKLIIPREDWSDYLGKVKALTSNHAVSLTLFNPNFASVYLSMIIAFLLVFLIPIVKKDINSDLHVMSKKERNVVALITAVLLLLLFKTYSRSGLLAVIIALAILGFMNRRLLRDKWKQCSLIAVSVILLFVGVDSLNHFRYITKITGTAESFFDSESEAMLESIVTNQDDVTIALGEETVKVSFSHTENGETSLLFMNQAGDDITDKYNEAAGYLDQGAFHNTSFYIKEMNGKNVIFCEINQITWRFDYDEETGFTYINDFGKKDKLKSIAKVGAASLEDIGSGRGYIWSRTIPLLKDTILIGKGPDTFLYVFPQSDYVGKANNCKTAYTLIEKPHNLYLMIAIHTGVISLLALLVFYLVYLIKSFAIYKNNDLSTLKARMGLGCMLGTVCYMVCGFFNDSSIQTTPLFVILLGIGLDINCHLEKHKIQ